MTLRSICLILCLFILLVTFVACSESESPLSHGFQRTATYSLTVPSDISPNSWRQKFYDDKYLYYLEQHEQKIVVFDMNAKSVVREITFQSSGTQNVGEVFSFSVFSPDSIVLASGPYPFNYIVDRAGKRIGKFAPEFPEGVNQVVDHTRLFSRYYADLSNDPEAVYFLQRIPYTEFFKEKTDHYPIMKLDKATQTYTPLDFKYPQEYFQKRLPRHMTFNHDDDNLYFGLIGDHDLYVIEKTTGTVEKHFLKSKFVPKEMKNTLDQSSPMDVMLYDAMNPRYTAVLPDPHRKLFYRIVCLPPTDLSLAKAKPTQLHYYPDRFSIMVLDEKMRVIHEEAFPERQYFPHGIFVNERGLNIPKTHPEYFVKLGNESEFVYDVFTLE